MAKQKRTVEVCANCGKLSNEPSDSFLCPLCKSHVCVVIPYPIFQQMVKAGLAKE